MRWGLVRTPPATTICPQHGVHTRGLKLTAGPFLVSPCRLAETTVVYPADVVLFEGILVFYSQEIRDMFHLRLFVDTDPDVRLSRRGKADAGLSAPGRPGHGSRGSEGPHLLLSPQFSGTCTVAGSWSRS